MRLVVNGKAAADADLRAAVEQIRNAGHRVEVRVTWESGDGARYAEQAVRAGADVVVATGGDGTVNEVAAGVLEAGSDRATAVAVVPYGTANDFAAGMGVVKGQPLEALQLALTGPVIRIDLGRVNQRVFVNVASGGFGAEVTTQTPAPLKKMLGGVAYSLMGLITVAKMDPYPCRFSTADGQVEEADLLLMSVGNGRLAGGGYSVAPHAALNDGLLDIVLVRDGDLAELTLALPELLDLSANSNRLVTYRQSSAFWLECDRPFQLSVDGESYRDMRFEFDVLPQALPLVVGPNAPVIGAAERDEDFDPDAAGEG